MLPSPAKRCTIGEALPADEAANVQELIAILVAIAKRHMAEAIRNSELYFYPPETAPEGALTVGDDLNLDLAPVVREDMLISMPMRLLCRPDCKGLCPHCGQNWNEGLCDCEDEKVDPRLAALSQLLKEAPESKA